MELKKVWAMYFSPTGGTEKAVKTTAQAVAEKLNLPLEIYDFTLPQGREKDAVFGEGDLVVCGTPVIAGRVPNVLLPYLTEKVKGNGAYAVPVVSFGNRNYDDALIELRNILEKDGGLPENAGKHCADLREGQHGRENGDACRGDS